MNIDNLLSEMASREASDLFLSVGSSPRFRVQGRLEEAGQDASLLTEAALVDFLERWLPPFALERFRQERELDIGLSLNTKKRFRLNLFQQRGLIDKINRNRSCHIVTIEDPIEFVHSNNQAVIEQREVHADTHSFASALKHVLRQDPDVILIGEMRDTETIAAALTAAETGHLVLATLHTNDAPQTVDRIIDIFPGERQNQIRTQLAATLDAVVAQRLLPLTGRKGERIAAFEVMLGTPGIRAQIRESRTHQLASSIETGSKDGMITLDKALMNLYTKNLISRASFKAVARNPSVI